MGVAIAFGIVAFTNTATIHAEGGFVVRLVAKPCHGVVPFYGGGEEGEWARKHPGQPSPWYFRGDYTELVGSNDEGGPPVWLWLYSALYCAWIGVVFVGTPIAIGISIAGNNQPNQAVEVDSGQPRGVEGGQVEQ